MVKKANPKKPAAKKKPETFATLENVLDAVEKKKTAVLEGDSNYRQAVIDLTGHDPKIPVGPIDVVKIVKHVFDKRYVQHD